MKARLPHLVLVWFALDLILILSPPLHWAMSGPQRVLGLPIALTYLVAVGLMTTASVVVAYFVDPSRGEA